MAIFFILVQDNIFEKHSENNSFSLATEELCGAVTAEESWMRKKR